MHILIAGAGAIGSLYGGLLTNAGYRVSVFARKPHAAAMFSSGLKICGQADLTVPVQAYDSVEFIHPADLMIVTCKAYDTEAILEVCGSLISDKTIILSLQNGLGNEEILTQYSENVIQGVTGNGVVFQENGKIQWTAKNSTVLGSNMSHLSSEVKQIMKYFQKAGLETHLSRSIQDDVFQKAICNAAINPLCAMYNIPNGELLKRPEITMQLTELIVEAVLVGEAMGRNIPTDMHDRVIQLIQKTEHNICSTLQDVRKGKRTEIEFINGKIIELGKKYGVRTCRNEWVMEKFTSS